MRAWSNARALSRWVVDNGPAFVGSFARFAVKLGIKAIIFGVPTTFVAQWCDVPPTWKSIAFMMFCIIWSDCVFDTKGSESSQSAKQGDPSVNRQKAAAVVLTPAEVAAEARKLSRAQKSLSDR
jgi:hypothetical protein